MEDPFFEQLTLSEHLHRGLNDLLRNRITVVRSEDELKKHLDSLFGLYEAVYHFNLFMWLSRFLQRTGGRVHPEFPTGNGRGPSGHDLFVRYHE
jgi:hypothetical protein